MDEATARYYAENAAHLAARYEDAASPVARLFPTAFAGGGRVLDVGAGSGRDLACLVEAGYDAYGVEPSAGLRQEAVARHPELAGRVAAGALPAIAEPFGRDPFDGLLCSAVLMHVPESALFDAAYALRRLLKPHGRLLLSLPSSRTDVGADERDGAGRLFKGYTAEYIQLLFERIGFQLIGRWQTEDALGRPGTAWYTLLLELRAGGAIRAIDQIEGILNRDRKVATYKLALFRALAEIAMQEPNLARWRHDGRVGVPLGRLAERWLMYYWPIFASALPIPQSQSEGAGSLKPVSFRAPMLALMRSFVGQGEHGGLTAWQLAWASDSLTSESQVHLRDALHSIASAIRSGPVAFSGGALESGRVFAYDGSTREVLMEAALWRELSLLGHWIVDAVILRWAALTERFAYRQGIRSGDVLQLLLASPDPERSTYVARSIYIEHGVDRCTWSDRSLRDRFDVDHVIAYSLWGCNDLWNLLPVDSKVNAAKSDRLPAASLLRERQESVVGHWRILRDGLPEAFDRQASRLLGRKLSSPLRWEDELFSRLREAVETTALQRGVERWTP